MAVAKARNKLKARLSRVVKDGGNILYGMCEEFSSVVRLPGGFRVISIHRLGDKVL